MGGRSAEVDQELPHALGASAGGSSRIGSEPLVCSTLIRWMDQRQNTTALEYIVALCSPALHCPSIAACSTRLELHGRCVSANAAAKPPRLSRTIACSACTPLIFLASVPDDDSTSTKGATVGWGPESVLHGRIFLRLKRACEQLLGPPIDSLPTRSHCPRSPWFHPCIACLSCSLPTDLLFSA